MTEKVILVDAKDNEIGTMEKMEAHKNGVRHRAVSVLIFNKKGELLLQKRAENKYHSAELWTNTACTHPAPNETNLLAANRRLFEEMGLKTELSEKFSFKYSAYLDNNLTENEFDHVFFGKTDKTPLLNLKETNDYKYISFLTLLTEIQQNPEKYTIWFKIILSEGEKEILKFINSLKSTQ